MSAEPVGDHETPEQAAWSAGHSDGWLGFARRDLEFGTDAEQHAYGSAYELARTEWASHVREVELVTQYEGGRHRAAEPAADSWWSRLLVRLAARWAR